ncbi:hypothetical protein RchiOBHm_Chr5g0078411 [Rosa chinensis]|uniref:Uncharacterized protein n=1 Tax=Rosa chinensis TaxID=74649 RepID=A0A2P6QMA2_ROSCH|nr:hypothetical protein RchiOBHm_Chr5g0078411 [Rosa chinensis]
MGSLLVVLMVAAVPIRIKATWGWRLMTRRRLGFSPDDNGLVFAPDNGDCVACAELGWIRTVVQIVPRFWAGRVNGGDGVKRRRRRGRGSQVAFASGGDGVGGEEVRRFFTSGVVELKGSVLWRDDGLGFTVRPWLHIPLGLSGILFWARVFCPKPIPMFLVYLFTIISLY